MNCQPPMQIQNVIKLMDSFIEICENAQPDLSRHRDKLNSILNSLNSCDFKYMQAIELSQKTEEMIKMLVCIPLSEDTILVKYARFMVHLLKKYPASIETNLFRDALKYLIEFIHLQKTVGLCEALRLLQALIKNHLKKDIETVGDESIELATLCELLLKIINDPNAMEKTTSSLYDGDSAIEIRSCAVFCLEALLTFYEKVPQIEEQTQAATTTLLTLIYSLRFDKATAQNYCMLMRASLSSLKYIGFSDKSWCTEHIGDLLGACIANILFGLPGIAYQTPQKVQSSQQAIHNVTSSSNLPNRTGGKVVKNRKPRQAAQPKLRKSGRSSEPIKADQDIDFAESFLRDDPGDVIGMHSFTTSDSEPSDVENNTQTKKSREKEAKLRMAALMLIVVIAKNVEKKVMFGYWHCLFPTEELTPTSVALLNCALRDPNSRCRITALQATSMVLHGMKNFLVQAETTNKPPSTFMPFSISLGNQLSAIYGALKQILSNENSLPVMIQTLKCLATLVQSTSFQKLRNSPGLLQGFITLIRRLVHHNDPTVKVAALIVMECLISRTEITNEIFEAVGLSRLQAVKNSRVHDYGEDQVIDAEEDLADIEYEDEAELLAQIPDECKLKESGPKMPWLLQIVLENLGVTVTPYKTPLQPSNSIQVRHQSLQIILVMAPHFQWIRPHLLLIAKALQNTINNEHPTIQQRTALCLDIVAHSTSMYLVSSPSDELMEMALQFWLALLPIVTQQLQDDKQIPTTKSTLCDAFSNIGVHVYERLTRLNKMHIVSLMCGISLGEDEPIVRASAVRALAVFVLYPSLKEDICYFENTIEAILKIMDHKTVPVRIKVSWALANVTDACVLNLQDLSTDRISDYTLQKLFEATDIICNDHDKVRTNAVRIYGNLLRLINETHLKSPEWSSLCMTAFQRLCEQARLPNTNSSMKVKWNACYAIGNATRNPILFSMNEKEFDWQQNVFETLSTVIADGTNFKVRINGAAALAIPDQRTQYGKYFFSMWRSLSIALYQANHLTDFCEYNHRDNLLDQLCITIAHFIMISTPADWIEMADIWMEHIDSNKPSWLRVINRMVPEKADSLLQANIHLKRCFSDHKLSLTSEQRNSLKVLVNSFVSATEYDE